MGKGINSAVKAKEQKLLIYFNEGGLNEFWVSAYYNTVITISACDNPQ
jgi:hypothetical protein